MLAVGITLRERLRLDEKRLFLNSDHFDSSPIWEPHTDRSGCEIENVCPGNWHRLAASHPARERPLSIPTERPLTRALWRCLLEPKGDPSTRLKYCWIS
jgi:hypothetical protein